MKMIAVQEHTDGITWIDEGSRVTSALLNWVDKKGKPQTTYLDAESVKILQALVRSNPVVKIR